MKRRNFLRHSFHAAGMAGLSGTFGFAMPTGKTLNSLMRLAAESNKVLVLVYLEGGNDGLNTAVPLDQLSALNSVRPHVILPENKLLKLPDAQIGLHPSLSGLFELYNQDRLEVIQSVGYPEQNYSHFRSTDIWMSASDSHELINSGWTGRYLSREFPTFPIGFPNDENPDPLSVEIGWGASLLFQGPSSSMSMVISNPDSFYQLVNNVEDEPDDSRSGEKLQYIQLIKKQSQLYGKRVQETASKVTQQKPFPDDNPLAQQLKIVSRLIAGGLTTPLYLVRIGSFDTHDAQVLEGDHTEGEHSDLLKQVNDAIMAFMNDLEYHGNDDKVIGMTFSEFGRRIVSNASLGTDHGSAAPMFIFGNKVRGGVLGSNPIISPATTYADNLPIQYDFRQVYSSVLEQWFGLETGATQEIMLKNFETVPVIGERNSAVTSLDPTMGDISLAAYPNPVRSGGIVSFKTMGQSVRIELIDVTGKVLQKIYEGKTQKGVNTLQWDTSGISRGNYLLKMTGNEINHVFKVAKL